MLISLKYIKYLKALWHVSILIDHQGVCLYLAKVTEYLKFKKFKNFKNTEFKIPTINSGVVAAIL